MEASDLRAEYRATRHRPRSASLPALEPRRPLARPVGQRRLAIEWQRQPTLLAWSQADLGEAGELAGWQRCAHPVGWAKVDLRHLGAEARTDIANRERHFPAIGMRGDGKIAVGETCVGQIRSRTGTRARSRWRRTNGIRQGRARGSRRPRRCRGTARAGWSAFARDRPGKVTGRRPPGSASPRRIAARASAPATPGYQVSSTAAVRASHGISTGAAVVRTTMVRGLAPAIAAISLSCCHGRSSVGRSCPSPASSQATTIAVRAEQAATTAAARAFSSASGLIQARRSRIGPFGPARALIAIA